MSFLQSALQFVSLLEDEARGAALQQSLPIVDDVLAGAAPSLSFTALRGGLTAAAQGLATPTAADLAAALGAPFQAQDMGDGTVRFRLQASATQTVAVAATPIAAAFGAPTPTTLSGAGALDGQLTTDLDVTLRYDPATDTLTVEQGVDALTVSGEIAVEVASAGVLDGVPVALTDQRAPSAPELVFSTGVDVAAPTPAGVTAKPPQITTAVLQVGLVTDAPAALPIPIGADVTAIWLPTQHATPIVSFADVGLDIGDLIDAVDPVLDPIRQVIFEGPVGGVVNAVTSPIPVLSAGIDAIGLTGAFDRIPTGGGDGVVNFLDIVGYYFLGEGDQAAFDALSAAAEALAVLRAIDELADRSGRIGFGAFSFDAGGAFQFTPASNDLIGDLSALLGGFAAQTGDPVPGLSPGGSGEFTDDDLTDETGLRFPLFQQPARIAEILLPSLLASDPDPVAFVEYDLPALEGGIFLGPYSFPIFGAVAVTLSGGIGFALDFRIGLDAQPTRLLSQGVPVTDVDFADGLFIGVDPLAEDQRLRNQSTNKRFEHEPVISSFSEVFVGVGVNLGIVQVGVEGGVAGFGGAFIDGTVDDQDVSGPSYDPTLPSTGRLEDIGDPCFFDVTGNVNAVIRARFTINFFFVSFSWEATLAETTIVDLEFGCDPVVDPVNGIASIAGANGDLALHAGVLADQGRRVVSGVAYGDAADHYIIEQALDENGVAIADTVRVGWRGLSDSFTLGEDGIISAVMENLARSPQSPNSVVLQEDLDIALFAVGGGEDDVFIGGAGDDTLVGGGGSDRLFGNDGDDSLAGGDGQDLLDGGAGADTLNGGAGRDKVDYYQSDAPVIMAGTGSPGVNFAATVSGGDAEGDVLISIEEVIGTRFADVLVVTVGAEAVLNRLGGALEGREGDDVLLGSLGNDLLIGGPGADRMAGFEARNATTYVTSLGGVEIDLDAGTGRGAEAEGDRLERIRLVQGSKWGDVIRGSSANEDFDGSFGDDLLDGRGGADRIFGGDGDDTVVGGLSDDVLSGDLDLLNLPRNNGLPPAQDPNLENLAAPPRPFGRDRVSYENAAAGVNVDLGAGFAFDIGNTARRDDLLRVREISPNIFLGGTPSPLGLSPLSTFEDITGTAFDDALFGDRGDNEIVGLAGDDTMRGGDGDDTLIGGLGADSIDGGFGTDLLDYSAGFRVGASLGLGVGLTDIAQGDAIGDVEDLIGTLGSDTLFGDAADNWIAPGLSRDDADEGAAGGRQSSVEDFVFFGAGRDTLRIDWSARDTGTGLVGGLQPDGAGSFERRQSPNGALLDAVTFQDAERLIVTGTIRADEAFGGEDDDQFYMGGGDDTVDAGGGADVVVLHEGDDVATYRGPASAIVDGVPEPGGPFFLDGGRGIDGLTLDFSDSGRDLRLEGPDGAEEFFGVNLVTPDGGAVVNFEVLADVTTGAGDDVVFQPGDVDNVFRGGDGEDTLSPGLGTDVVEGGRDFSEGDDIVTYAPFIGAAGVLFVVETEDTDAALANEGDLVFLDYRTAEGGVTGETQRTPSGVFLLGTQIDTNAGTYTGPGVDLTFSEIERMIALGSPFGDRLTGTHDSYLDARFAFGEIANFARGDDALGGDDGDDTLVGYSGDDTLVGGAGADVLIGGDPAAAALLGAVGAGVLTDIDEIDVLTGDAGADRFVLGVAFQAGPLDPVESGSLYLGAGNLNAALITDFTPGEGDVLQLAGAAADYATIAGPQGLELYRVGEGGADDDLIAVLEGVASLDLTGTAVDYVGPGNLGAAADVQGVIQFSAPAPVVQQSPIIITPPQPPLVIQPILPTLTAEDWAGQVNDPDLLLDALFTAPNPDGIDRSTERLTLSGDARGFGVFGADPFGLGGGIVLSTGRVEDLPGENLEDGGVAGPVVRPLSFTRVSDLIPDTTVFRADLTDLGFDIASLTIADDDDREGGSSGRFSGLDLDRVFLSRTRLDGATAGVLDAVDTLDVFDFSPAGARFTPGAIRSVPASNPNFGTELFGARNGLVDETVARLGVRDAVVGTTSPDGFLSFGDGGELALELTEAVDTSRELYLYIVEAGTGEDLEGRIAASSEGLEPPGDLSTDFGRPGAADDAVSMRYEFDAESAGMLALDLLFFSEEFIEFAGRLDNDTVGVTLNGVEMGRLSDGAALDINALRAAPLALNHPDFVWNPSQNSPDPGPLADIMRADGFTETLNLTGEAVAGRNVLEIELREHRDGWLDSGVLIGADSLRVVTRDDDLAGRPDLLADGTTLVEGGPTVAVPVTLAARPLAPLQIAFQPTADLDLGSGFGALHVEDVTPGGALSFDLMARALDDGVPEDVQFAPVTVSVSGADAGYDGLPVAPLLFTIVDGDGLPPEVPTLTLDGATGSDRLSGTDAGEVLRTLGGRSDRVEGGAGRDVFLFGAETANGVREQDRIMDYTPGEDWIAVPGGRDGVASVRDAGRFITLTLDGDGDRITVLGADDPDQIAFLDADLFT